MSRLRPFRSVEEIKEDITRFRSDSISYAGRLYQCMPLLLGLLREIHKELQHKRARRRPSAYNLHVRREIKRGKSFQAAAESWRRKRC